MVIPGADRRDPPPEPIGHLSVAGADRLPPSAAELERLRRVADGEEDADLVVRGGLVVVVHDGTVVNRDILIVGRYIAAVTRPGVLSGRRSLDAAGRYVVPAYVDAGLRVEETLLSPGELARLLIPRGTVTLLTDPAALIALGGARGSELATGSATPLRVLLRSGGALPPAADLPPAAPVPPVPPATGSAAVPPASPTTTSVVEVTPAPPGTGVSGLSALGAGPVADAAGLRWALENPGRTRSRTVTELATHGHLDHDVRLAVGQGMGPIDAIRHATLLPARMHGLESTLGAIAPARLADLQVVSTLAGTAPPDVVVAGGRIAAERGRPLFDNLDVAPAWAVGRIRLPANLHAGSFTCPGLRRAGRQDASVAAVSIDVPREPPNPPVAGGPARNPLGVAGPEPATETARRHGLRTVRVQPTVHGGYAVADPTRDLHKVAVFEQDGGGGPVDIGLIRGCGLSRGALGVSTAHAPGHVIVVGARDDDMLTAARAVEGMGGGFVVVDRGWVRAACPLPLLGLMSDAPWEAVLGELAAVDTAAADLGCRLPFPLRTLATLGRLLYTRP
ncbi:adenine deaminase C-terminal domain-containing protein [Frankia sp. QA3]|uniref:adenine deaminase C-terminal domain-containing protein n=1 Tax=Frankia sp. QA3 TaxID=710111 RepID=UPI000269CA87|nr:adenine deaminase C-terminal domain-containing protein [Frankia sp. QA3]EIV93804.1 adenine deaminase [Frankia sp. QA3]